MSDPRTPSLSEQVAALEAIYTVAAHILSNASVMRESLTHLDVQQGETWLSSPDYDALEKALDDYEAYWPSDDAE